MYETDDIKSFGVISPFRKPGIRSICGSTLFIYNPYESGVTEERQSTKTAVTVLFAVVVLAAALAGCTSSVQDDSNGQPMMDAYVNAYSAGMDHHSLAQDYFNAGTRAWENSDLRQSVADYANASMEYDAAANSYSQMARYSGSPRDEEFGNSLRGCTFNLSLASDSFMNAAIALGRNDTEKAYDLFEEGQSYVNSSDAMLNRSIEFTPEWMLSLMSG